MLRLRGISICAALVVTLATLPTGSVQAQVDVTNPAPDTGIPDLLTGINSLIRPQDIAVLRFDSLLDPSNGADPSRLTAAAQSILHNHQVAQQQVELAIRYLLANRDEIVAGKNAPFNQIFGKAGRKQKVAVLAPVSLPGTFDLTSPTLLQSQPQAQQGGNTNRPTVSVATQVNAGDSIFLVDPTSNVVQGNNNFQRVTYPSLSTVGYVVRISAVIRGGVNAAGGGGQNNQNQNQNTDLILDPAFSNVPTGLTLSGVTGWRVVRFDEVDDPSVYNQVLATFMAIRDALAGFDPSLGRGTQTQNDLIYHRRFRDINSEYRVGDGILAGSLTPLNTLIGDVIPGRGADRLARQAGFSVSDSYFHLDRLEDIGNGQTTDRLGRPVVPLLWTEDNTIPLTFNSRVQDPNATDEDRAFFHDRQTIFGGRNDPFDQYLGRSFLEEKILETGNGFFDTGVAGAPLDQGLRDQRSPAGGPRVVLGNSSTGLGTSNYVTETANIPETGKDTPSKTLKKWQMILESFAEFNTNLDQRDLNDPRIKHIAAIGLMDMVGGGASSAIRASDAGNYALFADLLRTSGGSGIDFSRVEPIGKRGNGGFNPVVPAN